MFAPVSLFAVFTGTIAYMALGMFWYSPVAFGNLWARHQNMNPANMRPTPMHFIGAAIVAFLASWSMAQLIAWTSPFMGVHALMVGFVAWLGLTAAPSYSQVIWAGQSVMVFMINVTGLLVKTLMLSALFYFWR